MRNSHIDKYDKIDRDVVALGNDYAQGFVLPAHRHRRAQLLYGATGLMHVSTQAGEWVVPPQHAVWIPPDTAHSVKFVGVSTRSLYIEPVCAADLRDSDRCRVISVSPLLRQLLIEAVDLPLLYASDRDRSLVQLLLLELAAMPVREFDIPLPQHPALLAQCQNFLQAPTIHDAADRWASALFMSLSTFRRHFLQQTGLSFSAWRQRACVVTALARLVAGKSVNDVALSLGYDSSSAFSTMFRRVTGQVPSFYSDHS
ncbi:helix-turn-helix transcriptional regulator [Pantoea sp. DY-15]|uniref:AraC family transcriptional regulator n=1 Tax=unclassified Pantoea TaxID=2630326 RepID=UPI001C974B0B|nr:MULTISPECIES: helix-turn-helix transcriptional regulator [unclassified Pantoea]MBY4840324.1 helix-turn-helix transcriptional regulator [Pantoea sp. DY-5]MBY4888356.1 helix-turn-helix transcriptional regulator [Pantoea sp. DY-15]